MRHLIMCALAVATPAATAPTNSAYTQLLAADRSYSDQARGKPLPEAIAAMMDKDAVLVAGGAAELVRGPEAIRARLAAKPENLTATVSWMPVGGGVSADGSQGFTYGAMTVRPSGGPPQPLKYLAYWVHGPDGWRVFGYKRVGAREGVALTPGAPILGTGPRRRDDAAAALKASESGFSNEAQKIGLRAAFQKWGRADSINIGAADSIAVGARAIGEGIAGPEPVSSVTWAADQVLVAPSGDMGLSYGLLHLNQPQPGGRATIPFFTVWARPRPGDPWRYVAE